jgi:hypothetical protein
MAGIGAIFNAARDRLWAVSASALNSNGRAISYNIWRIFTTLRQGAMLGARHTGKPDDTVAENVKTKWMGCGFYTIRFARIFAYYRLRPENFFFAKMGVLSSQTRFWRVFFA